jgi:hypothetical protein
MWVLAQPVPMHLGLDDPLCPRERNTSNLVNGGGRACYAVGDWRQDEGNGWIENCSDCGR